MRYKVIALLIPFLLCLWATWDLNNNPAYQRRSESPYLVLDNQTKFAEKTGVLYSPTWRVCVTLMGRPTKAKELRGVCEVTPAASFEAPGISYLVGPRTTSITCKPEDTCFDQVTKQAKYECSKMVGAVRGRESAGYPVTLDNGRYPGYYSEGFCEKNQYYKTKVYIDDENQSPRMVPFYLIVKGEYDLVNSKQTDEFFNSFRLLPRSSSGKI